MILYQKIDFVISQNRISDYKIHFVISKTRKCDMYKMFKTMMRLKWTNKLLSPSGEVLVGGATSQSLGTQL